MDETGLFQKLTLNRILATKAGNSGKKSKDCVTIAFTVNGDGSDNWEPWFIGKSKKPRCFKHINKKLLGVQYRNNKTKWITGEIMKEYLLWLNEKLKS